MSNSSPTAEIEAILEAMPGWRREVSSRVSAHRTRRRPSPDQQPALPGMEPGIDPPAPAEETASVAARVAERYAMVPTYSEVLAAKASRAAEVATHAAREAQQAAQAVNDVLWASAEARIEDRIETEIEAGPQPAPQPPAAPYRIDPASLPLARSSQPHFRKPLADTLEPHPHIVDPFEDALVAPPQPLPARVLEFPRELVAARKARPRIAEGPLRDADPEPDQEQLRIFEVESGAISRQPAAAAAGAEGAALPEWSSIRLDAIPRNIEENMSAAPATAERSKGAARSGSVSRSAPLSSRAAPKARSAGYGSRMEGILPLHVAPIQDRIVAAAVDMAFAACALLLFIAVFSACTAHPPTGKPALVAAAATLLGFIALYQWLFFTYAEGTPGMRFARIALCTFDDENPVRKTLQHRVAALFLAALPMGLGFLWALLDDECLGWHDRMTRTYQRSYR